ncbi:PREDICTED: LOW QUALITY PROTEIN: ADNP homeobox protein 2 [Tinamus guttatus]|uniref:LOW QUALITY PROTEIN: ADNP homeobox protein 2 n=1 Tax=Tinamus guttatus TaxID=94827 RepID=UPI00052EF978|nr:PREDICTED: LOW QUALITY PROTEIN: ADNP homeobox protein 2 [Tinamus guttatus]
MFQIPVQNLDNIRKARKKVKGILVDIGLDSCRELLKNLKSFDPGEKYFSNTSWSDVSLWEAVGKRKRYRTKPYCCSLCKFSSKLLTSFKNHLHRYHEDEMDQELLVPCPKCAFASDPKIVGKHIRMFHSSNKRIQNYTVSILDGMKQFRSDIINFMCLKCHFTDTLYYNMKKHVLMNHFENLISVYFGLRLEEKEKKSFEHFCKKCNASANSRDSLMYHVLTSETHRDLENKLRSLISEHIRKPGLVKQMHIAPKPPAAVAVAAHVPLVPSNLPVGQNAVNIQPPPSQPIIVSHRLPLNNSVGALNRAVAPAVLPLNPPVRPGLFPINQPIGAISAPVAAGAVPVAQPVSPINQPVAPGVLAVNPSPGTVNRPLGPRVLPVAQTVASGVLQLNQPVAPGVVPVRQPVRPGFLQLNQPVDPGTIPVNQPVRPAVSQNAAFLTAGPILRQLIPTGKPVVVASQSAALQASPPAPDASPAVKQAKQWKTCPVCSELFPSNVYQVHMEVAHKHGEIKVEENLEPDRLAACAPFLRWMTEKTVRCLSCKCFLCEEELMKHLLMHGLACLFCTRIFHDLKSLVEHSKTKHIGKKKVRVDYSNRGFQLDNDAQGNLLFPRFDFSTVLPKEEIGENEVYLAVLAGISARTLVPIYIKVTPQTAEGKTWCNKVFTCPFCFGKFSEDCYEMHLKERHHVMPTVHTILKSPAFKCIHCCGVYTGNMTLTAIAVHLLRCRSAPKDSNSSMKMQLERSEKKEPLFINGENVALKRKQPESCSFTEDQTSREQQPHALSSGLALSSGKEGSSGVVPFKRHKTHARSELRKLLYSNDDLRTLAVDPQQYDHRSYEGQKQFLTDYFHKRPYPTKREMELLSAVLCVPKVDVATFFGKKRSVCLRAIKSHSPSVLLGFSVSELKNVKHSLSIKDEPLDM